MARDQRVQLGHRAPQLRLHPQVEVRRRASRIDDPLGGKVAEQRGSIGEPGAMRAQTSDEPIASIGDLAPQLDELRGEVGFLREVPRGPAVASIGVVINERGTFAGYVRELTHVGQLAQLLFDPALEAP